MLRSLVGSEMCIRDRLIRNIGVAMQGPLSLKRKILPSYRKIHCSLPNGSVLLTVHPKEGQPAETTISLTGAVVRQPGSDPRYFDVQVTGTEERNYHFYHESEDIAQEWVRALTNVTDPAVEADVAMLQQLMTMGLPEPLCRRALEATKNANVEQAAEWCFAHENDPDPVVAPSGSGRGASNSGVSQEWKVCFKNGISYRSEPNYSARLPAVAQNKMVVRGFGTVQGEKGEWVQTEMGYLPVKNTDGSTLLKPVKGSSKQSHADSSPRSGSGSRRYQVVHRAGVAYRRTPCLADKILDRRGPTLADVVTGSAQPVEGSDGLQYVQVSEGSSMLGWLPLAVRGQSGDMVQVLVDASNPEASLLAQEEAELMQAIAASMSTQDLSLIHI
eukprot:TRINITY_DN850_c0_g2_i2.p1 TRINITY_DN850_c0_g2~~TRINITY_DN850_c0_g2_i2.p1  ORF type:complete len:428 (+),score=143.67 TRINITY_DN850_c0_g2_i2:124-1284(+)